MGYILNLSIPERPAVFLNTSFKPFNEVRVSLLENTRISNIEEDSPTFLNDWTKILELVLMGEDQDTSHIPLDLSGYTSKQAKVIDTVHKKIPVNEFVSYSEVAEMSGFPNAQRFVGSTMKICRQYPIIPCKRVKNSQWLQRFKRRNPSNTKTRVSKTPL